MVEVPAVRYARSGEVNVAYCRWGKGADTVVFTPPLVSNVEMMWELTEWERCLRWAGEHHDTIMIDKRGVGLSDRVSTPPSLDDRVSDVLAVMEAEHVDRAHLVGQSEGGWAAVAIAARHPERVCSIVLVGAPALGALRGELEALSDSDAPVPAEHQEHEKFGNLVRHWGSESSVNLELFAPRAFADPRIRRWYQRFERQSASPGAILGFLRSIAGGDIVPLLEQVRARTLVVHGHGDRVVHVSNGRYLANAIPGARYIEYPTDDHVWQLAPEWRMWHDDLIEFVTGGRPEPSIQRMFATVLFTDLVDSTVRESAVGDERWRQMLDTHDRLARELINGQSGRLVKHTGDGVLATFSDPLDATSAAQRLVHELRAIGLPIRAGLHSGGIEVRDDGDIAGIAVNIAARVQALADEGEILVSRTVRDLMLGAPVRFEDRGEFELKGIEGKWRLYSVPST